MAKFDTSYSDRQHYRSHFSSTALRLLSFLGCVLLALTCLTIFVEGIVQLLISPFQLPAWLNMLTSRWRSPLFTGGLTAIFLAYSLLGSEWHWHVGVQNHRMSQRRYRRYLCIVGGSAVVVLALLFWWPYVMQRSMPPWAIWLTASISLLGLVCFALLVDIRVFLNKQFAIWRKLWRAPRHHRIRTDFVPTEEPVRWSDRIVSLWSRLGMYIHDDRLMFIIALLIGGLIIPILKVAAEKDFETITLSPFKVNVSLPNVIVDLSHMAWAFFPDGLVGIGVIFGMLLAFSYFLRRQRYIFVPFTLAETPTAERTVSGDEVKNMQHLDSAAKHLTQQFIEHLEQIGGLLSTRYVADVQDSHRLPLTEFITSGGDDAFLTAIQSLVNIDERAQGIAGRLIAALTKVLALITITGMLRRRDETTLELEVRLTKRLGNQTSIIVPIISSHGTDELLDDATAATVARNAAIRLLVRTGVVAHLASSETSLAAFLDGLAASAAHNWWRAAASYRQAIH